MIVELAGLPGCGKSTLLKETATLLASRGQPCDNLRNVARAGAAEMAKGRRFLRGKPERTNLYGAIMALDEPGGPARALFDWSEGNPSLRLWNMEMLAQLWFAGAAVQPETPVLLDEGIVHRLAVSAMLAGKPEDAVTRLRGAPPAHGVVIMDCPPGLAMDRCTARPRGVPPGFSKASGAADPARFRDFADLLHQCGGTLSDAGVRVITLDAAQSVTVLAAQLADWIAAGVAT